MRTCARCGTANWIEVHHIFSGANRKKSEKYGYLIDLCHYCHNEPPYGAHFSKEYTQQLRAKAQKIFEATQGQAAKERGMTVREWFIKEFGRSYL
jgi:hypothetical protein